MDQRTPEWFAARLGKVTASRVADVVARTRSGWGASRANYMAQLIAERLTGQQQDSYTNAAMQWGTETEPQARDAYSFLTDLDVVEVGFMDHPQIGMAGASPDGMIGKDGLVEIKCPNTATHIDFLLNGVIADKYHKQMQWQMACAGRRWCDFVSFDPRLPGDLQIRVERVDRDDDVIAGLEKDVAEFLAELETKLEALNALREAA